MHIIFRAARIAATIGLFVGMAAAARAECEDLVRSFHAAVASKSVDGARKAAADIGTDIFCGDRSDEFQRRLVEFLIGLAADRTTPDATRDSALKAAQASLEISGNWQTALKLADYYYERRNGPNALAWYEKALSFVSTRPATRASTDDKKRLQARAGAAKLLANNDEEGAKQVAFAGSMRELDGSIGGIYARELLRGVDVLTVPIPINFFTGETRFTPDGEKAALELASVAVEQKVGRMKLVGHADERGADAFNMDLSKRRVERVRDFLLSKGVRARIEIEWRGARQPFDVNQLAGPVTRDETWALDRRVEWLRGGDE